MALPGPTDSPEMPFEISCTGAEPGPPGPTGEPTETTIITDTTVLDQQNFSFGLKIVESEDAGGGDPAAPPPPDITFTPKSFEIVITPGHGLDITDDGLTFSGKYSSALFPGASITYLDIDYNQHTVFDWLDVPDKSDPNFFSIMKFQDSTVLSFNVSFSVTAVIQEGDGSVPDHVLTKTYTNLVTGDWTAGRDKMRQYF